MEKIRFKGFSHTFGEYMFAELEVIDDRYESYRLKVPIILAPGESPSEERILSIINDEIKRGKEYMKPYQEFIDKYRGREILIEGEKNE